jgi:hypothetical protein
MKTSQTKTPKSRNGYLVVLHGGVDLEFEWLTQKKEAIRTFNEQKRQARKLVRADKGAIKVYLFQSPETENPQEVEQLCGQHEKTALCCEVVKHPSDPNLSVRELVDLAEWYPKEVLANPALPLLILENPSLGKFIEHLKVEEEITNTLRQKKFFSDCVYAALVHALKQGASNDCYRAVSEKSEHLMGTEEALEYFAKLVGTAGKSTFVEERAWQLSYLRTY